LLEAGVPSTVQLVPGTAHAKGYMAYAIDASLSFLKNVLN